jgi:hypothetical protein
MKKMFAAAGIGAILLSGAPPGCRAAGADTGAAFSYTTTSPGADASFYRLLTTGSHAMTVWNFPLVRAQGLEACQRWANGATLLDPIYILMAEGPYSFDQANAITSSASTAYCIPAFARAAGTPLLPNSSDGD